MRFPLILTGIGIYLGGLLLGMSLPGDESREMREVPASIPAPSVQAGTATKTRPFSERAAVAADLLDSEEELSRFIDELNLTEIHSALEELERLPRQHRKKVRNLLLARWAQLDGAGAAGYACSMTEYHLQAGRDALALVMEEWGRIDPDAARKFLPNISSRSLREGAREKLALSVLRLDPFKALEILMESPDNRSLYTLSRVLRGAAREDPRIAISAALRMGGESNFKFIGSGWAKRDPVAALAWARSIQNEKTREDVIKSVATTWAESAPLKAIEAFERTDLSCPLPQILSTWIMTDWKAAYAWIQALPDEESRDACMGITQPTFMMRNPDKFLDASKGDFSEGAISRLTASILYWDALDSSRALAWARRQSDPRVRAIIWPAIIGGRADSHPEEALSLAQEFQGELRQEVLLSVVENWSRVDPKAAAAWVNKQYDGPQKTKQMEKVASVWSRADGKAVQEWINTLPPVHQEAARRQLQKE